jgi:hypothetical protein
MQQDIERARRWRAALQYVAALVLGLSAIAISVLQGN